MEKQAGAGLDGLLKTIKDFVSNNKEMIIGGLAGSGLGALGGYNMVDDYGLSEDEAYNARLRGGIIGGLTGLLGGGLAGHLVGTAGGAAAAGSGGENDKPKLENTPTPAASDAQGEAPVKVEDTTTDSDTSERVSTDTDGPDYEPAGGYGVTAVGGAVGAGAGVYAGGRLQGRYQAFNKQRTTDATNAANSAKLKATYARADYRQAVRNTDSPYVKAMKDDNFKVLNPVTGEVATLKELKQRHKIITAGARKKMKAYNKTVAETAAAYNKALAKQVKATATLKKAPRLAGRTGGGIIGGLIGLGSTLLGQNAVDYSQGE